MSLSLHIIDKCLQKYSCLLPLSTIYTIYMGHWRSSNYSQPLLKSIQKYFTTHLLFISQIHFVVINFFVYFFLLTWYLFFCHLIYSLCRWDVNRLEELPKYMKLCFLCLINEINQIGYIILRDKEFNAIPYLKKSVRILAV